MSEASGLNADYVSISSDVRDNYDAFYSDRYSPEEREWLRKSARNKARNITSLCADVPHSSILEIGSGDGSVLQELNSVGFGSNLFALEVSEKALEYTRHRGLARLRESVLYDGYHIPYPDQSFDVAVMSHVVEHLEHPRLMMNEAARVARYIFVEVPLESTVFLRDDYVPDYVGHINTYSYKTIRRFIQSCGLSVRNQVVTNPSSDVYRHRYGTAGWLVFAATQSLIHLFPPLAMKLFVYNCSLLCSKQKE